MIAKKKKQRDRESEEGVLTAGIEGVDDQKDDKRCDVRQCLQVVYANQICM